MKKIYIIGAGGFGREVAWLIERINNVSPVWDFRGFIDDDTSKCGMKEGGYPIVGNSDFLERCGEKVWAVCAIGSAATRKKVVEKVGKYDNVTFATLLDPDVLFSPSVSIGEGTIICAGSILTVDITVGKHVIINLDSTVGHDVVIEDFVTIYPSVNISGGTILRREAELGTGTQVIQGKEIGSETIVGAGSVITKDLPCRCTAVGAPARPVKYKDEQNPEPVSIKEC